MKKIGIFKKDFYERIGGLKKFSGLKVLDVGCGDGEDASEISNFAKIVTGVDIIKNSHWKQIKSKNVKFIISKAEKLPFKTDSFNGLFLKDVIHHVEDVEKVMREIKRVATSNAKIILIEGNRYNPLFYIHMTKMNGHEHLSQQDFKKLVLKYFPRAKFIHFESHYVPFLNEKQFKILIMIEKLMEKVPFLNKLLSYNAALVN